MTTTAISRRALQDAITAQYIQAVKVGQHWHYVRVWPDGDITRGMEPSKSVPESEYFQRGRPHPVTCWSMTSNWIAGPGDGVFEWEDTDADGAEFYRSQDWQSYSEEPDDRHTIPCRLSDSLVDGFDWDSLMPDIEEALEEAGYTLED